MGRLATWLGAAAGIVFAVILFVSCGGGGDGGEDATATPQPSPTPSVTVITSDDGKLSIAIPNGAVPAGTIISITAVPLEQLPIELQQLKGAGTGYRLEPDGLVFSQPAEATLRLDRANLPDAQGSMSAYALVSFNEANGREVLPGQSTTASVTGSEVVVRGQLTHFSTLGTTQGSLEVSLDTVPRQQAVGATFSADAGARNLNKDLVRLTEPEGAFVASGTVSAAGNDIYIGHDNEEQLNAEGFSNTGTFHCDVEGPGTYGVEAKIKSVVIEAPEAVTDLTVQLEGDVECVEAGGGATQPPPGPTNTPAAGGAPTLKIVQTAGCDHTQPGVQSEFQKRVKVTDASGNPVAGVKVDEQATGPGFRGPGGQPVQTATQSATTDANGEARLVFTIVRPGEYVATVQRLTLPDGRLAVFDQASTLQTRFTVGQTCATPVAP